MSERQSAHAWLHLCSDGTGTRIGVIGAAQAHVSWASTARPGEIDVRLRELIDALDAERVLAYDCRMIAALLSRPDIAEAGSAARTHLREVLAGALIALPTARDLSLPAVAAELGLEAPDRIIDDPEAGAALCREVARALGGRLAELPLPALALVRELLAADEDFGWLPWDELDVPPLKGAAIDMLLADRPTVPKSRKRESMQLQAPLADTAASILGPDGPVAQRLARYEDRPGQVEMAEGVARALQDGEILMVEAGTGVGKSLAYLVPAILFSRASGEPIVVSTNTKNLQEQLINKDLPLLRTSLGVDFSSALLKGRSNYVCLRRFESAVRDALGSMLPDDRRAAAYLVSWLAHSDACDLDLIPAEATRVFDGLTTLIDRVRSERATCLGPGCPHASRCAVRVARARARNADIVVSNHALTLADTQFDVLPATGHVIFDEAHNLEAVATDQLGYEVSNFSLTDMRRTFGDDRRRGFLDSLAQYRAEAAPARVQEVSGPAGRLQAAVQELGEAGERLGAAVIELCTELDPEAQAGRARVRLGPEVYATGRWQQVGEAVQGLRQRLTVADDALAEIADMLAEGAERGTPESELSLEAMGARNAVAELNSALGTVMDDEPGAGYVLWAGTVRRRWGEHWRLCAAPIDVGPALQKAVYSERESVVMTSATLTVDGTFDYMRQRLGLADGAAVREQMVPSPFSYPDQLLLCVPTDVPTRGEEGREEALDQALLDIAEVAGGGLLVLFTARSQMDRVYGRIRERLVEMGLSPICQYRSGPRSWLLQQLRERSDTVLFGLKSFWEGVDVPGQALRCVVIVKLPFAVPTDPLVEARCEHAAAGGPGGYDYYIPEAILGFKQGIGRLVRATTDQGVVFVLDNRIVARSYGRRFFASIPQGRFEVGELLECLREAERWLRRA